MDLFTSLWHSAESRGDDLAFFALVDLMEETGDERAKAFREATEFIPAPWTLNWSDGPEHTCYWTPESVGTDRFYLLQHHINHVVFHEPEEKQKHYYALSTARLALAQANHLVQQWWFPAAKEAARRTKRDRLTICKNYLTFSKKGFYQGTTVAELTEELVDQQEFYNNRDLPMEWDELDRMMEEHMQARRQRRARG